MENKKYPEGYNDRDFDMSGDYVNDYGDYEGLHYDLEEDRIVFKLFYEGEVFETVMTTKEQGDSFIDNSRLFLGC